MVVFTPPASSKRTNHAVMRENKQIISSLLESSVHNVPPVITEKSGNESDECVLSYSIDLIKMILKDNASLKQQKLNYQKILLVRLSQF